MHPNELDDLFRQQLDGHASEPGADLWARLQAHAASSEVAGAASGPAAMPASAPQAGAADLFDTRFRTGLAGHATPPRRELWERLEDEHLRPRQRRRPVVAWGRLAVAASLLLLLLAGGAGLWLRHPGPAAGPLATAPRPAAPASHPTATDAGAPAATTVPTAPASPAAASAPTATGTSPTAGALAGTALADREKTAEIFAPRATGRPASPSGSPVARTTRLRRPAPALPGQQLPPTGPTPDAATGQPVTPGARPTIVVLGPGLPGPGRPTPVAEPEVILVEVRRGPDPGTPAPAARPAVVAAASPRPQPRRRLRLGGLLRQADHLVRGEQVSLADAGLPDSLTLQTRVGGRWLGGTIRL